MADRTYDNPFYDGLLYSLVFDRLLKPLHQKVATWVAEDSVCIDLCCGTGGLTTQLASRCRRVEGVDLSPSMVARAERLRKRRGLDNVSYRVGDASRLDGVADKAYDFATVSMGLHELPVQVRTGVLDEMLRVARAVVVVDFAVPMPRNLSGIRNRIIELMAGPRHFGGFRDFGRRGGLAALIEGAGARVERERLLDHGTLALVEILG